MILFKLCNNGRNLVFLSCGGDLIHRAENEKRERKKRDSRIKRGRR
jgi:hypothetical protein